MSDSVENVDEVIRQMHLRALRLEEGIQRSISTQSLTIFDKHGVDRAWIRQNDSGTIELCLADGNGVMRLRASVDASGTPKIGFIDQRGVESMAIALNDATGPEMLISTPENEAELRVGSLPDGSIGFEIAGGPERNHIRVCLDSKRKPVFEVTKADSEESC